MRGLTKQDRSLLAYLSQRSRRDDKAKIAWEAFGESQVELAVQTAKEAWDRELLRSELSGGEHFVRAGVGMRCQIGSKYGRLSVTLSPDALEIGGEMAPSLLLEVQGAKLGHYQLDSRELPRDDAEALAQVYALAVASAYGAEVRETWARRELMLQQSSYVEQRREEVQKRLLDSLGELTAEVQT